MPDTEEENWPIIIIYFCTCVYRDAVYVQCMCRCTHAEAREGHHLPTLHYSFEVRSLSEHRPHVFWKRPRPRNPCVSVAISTGVPGMHVPCMHFMWILRSILWLSCTNSKYMRYILPWAELYLLVCYWYFVYVGNYLNKNITIIIFHNVCWFYKYNFFYFICLFCFLTN